jgi:hypothetical protein
MAKKKTKKDPYAGMTADEIIASTGADLQYDPQISQIYDLFKQNARQRQSDISSAKQTAQSTIAYANAQRPTIRNIYARGGEQAASNATAVTRALGNMAPDNPYAREIAAELGGTKSRINEARVGALTGLTNEVVGAKAGRAAAINAARASFRENKGTLSQKLLDIKGAKGKYLANTLATLGEKAADRTAAAERADQPYSSGAFTGKTPSWVKSHPQKAQELKDAWNKLTHPGPGGPSSTAKGKDRALTFSDAVNRAASYAQKGFDQGYKRSDVTNALIQGHVLETGEKGQPTPSFSTLAVKAAADMVFDGHISRPTAQALHQYGYKVKDIEHAISASDFFQRQLREPKTSADYQAKRRVAYAGDDWLAKMRAALGLS